MRSRKILAIFLAVLLTIALFAVLLHGHSVDVLNPKGQIASKQRDLIVYTFLLGMLVVVPVLIMTFFIAWRYRESNTKATYTPNWDGSRLAETIWWGIPIILIVIVSVITWRSSYALDPYKKIASDKKPITIQVVALQWKWLFIYPEQHIATVNYIQFPEDTPVEFKITSDAPMNSFWIPQLGGQIYAMSGMSTQLNLIADEVGSYRGSSANISGKGFAGMKFDARATSQSDFDAWVTKTQATQTRLTKAEYDVLSKPSENNSQASYRAMDDALYDKIIAKFILPTSSSEGTRTSGSSRSYIEHGAAHNGSSR